MTAAKYVFALLLMFGVYACAVEYGDEPVPSGVSQVDQEVGAATNIQPGQCMEGFCNVSTEPGVTDCRICTGGGGGGGGGDPTGGGGGGGGSCPGGHSGFLFSYTGSSGSACTVFSHPTAPKLAIHHCCRSGVCSDHNACAPGYIPDGIFCVPSSILDP